MTIRKGDTAVIIDGVYHQAPALRHKEILAAMGRGVRVIGAASIGALRAAELAPFGMLGVGSVFTAYARGDIDGDDEVAVGQAPDGEWAALSWPLVNLRHVVQLAQLAGLLDGERASALLADLRAVYYPQRTTGAVHAVCRRRGEHEFAGWLAEQRERDPGFGDVKRADALAAVRTALDGWTPRAEARLAPGTWESPYFWQWSNAFACSRIDGRTLFTRDRLLYQQVCGPTFPQTWMAYLTCRSLLPPGGGCGRPLEERLAEITGDLAAHQVFHPTLDLRDETAVSLLLADETREDQQAVARYADALTAARRSRPGFSTAAVRDDLTLRMLLEAWRCPEDRLDEEASARGLVCAARAAQAAKRMVPGFLAEQKEAAHSVR
ncbi:TfuA domain-containing protein [Streptomyces sp. KMM 9044]|uniref:TfuA domain-containing protein n=1 Tax=Streptomyces sp. KMM 9044 TaxID=2744474 RepID=UPI0021518BDF|nr:TfuA domain-containing protein [Streptomyces sp. KMM 9044]WAX81273.1 TfuA domain-containing protein [Streptomyces sp. KMM 9044]